MNGKWTSCLALGVGVVFAVAVPAWADFPFDGLITLSRVEADPDATYLLSEQNGPWLIMTCSFSGEGAEQQAKELVYELRKRYKMPAYMHKMDFEFGEAYSRCFSRYGGQRKARYIRGPEAEEIAVLVGDFNEVDDANSQKVLEKIKYLKPECLKTSKGKKTNVTLAGWRSVVKSYQKMLDNGKEKRGPMGSAFMIPNPLRPKEYFTPGGVDKFVEEMNSLFEYSLLKCPGKYTVQVATFTGRSVLKKESEITDTDLRLKGDSKLDQAGLQAHNLTVALRAKGYEAYEFHEQYASTVTVGSFESAGTPRPDGKIEINPAIHQIMNTFAGKPLQPGQVPAGMPNLGMSPQVIAGIPLDVQPKPVLVPKRSIGADYARDTTNAR